MIVPLDNRVLVSGQIEVADIGDLKGMGVTLIINNRPDGESPDQPVGHDIAAATRAAGLDYVEVPVTGLPDSSALQQLSVALATLPDDGRALMFCRSGMRSAAAWALVSVSDGTLSATEARDIAARAGYDLSRLPL